MIVALGIAIWFGILALRAGKGGAGAALFAIIGILGAYLVSMLFGLGGIVAGTGVCGLLAFLAGVRPVRVALYMVAMLLAAKGISVVFGFMGIVNGTAPADYLATYSGATFLTTVAMILIGRKLLPPGNVPVEQAPQAPVVKAESETGRVSRPDLGKRRLPRLQELGLVVVVLVLSAFIWSQAGENVHSFNAMTVKNSQGQEVNLPAVDIHEDKFLSTANIFLVFTQMSWMAVMAVGLTIVIISGGIDISVGSVMGFAALTCAAVLQNFPNGTPLNVNVFGLFSFVIPHTPAVLMMGIGIPLGVGLACGLLNGIIVIGLRMHPFIVTLATMSMFRWACLRMAKDGSLPAKDKVLPDVFGDDFVAWKLDFAKYGGRAMESLQLTPLLVMTGIALLAWVYLRHTIWGRETYAIGGNEEAARFSGIRVPWVKLRVYAISGLCAGIAGMLSCGFFKSAVTNTGQGYELTVVAAAVVGGASLVGGRGTALGAVLGMLVIQLIDNGTKVLNPQIVLPAPLLFLSSPFNWLKFAVPVESKDTLLINGASIIIAVAIDQVSRYLQEHRLSILKFK